MEAFLARLALLLEGAWELIPARMGGVRFALPWGGPMALFTGAALALLLAVVCYVRTTEGLTRRSRLVLAGCRLTALASLLLMLLGAVVSLEVSEPVRPPLLVVVDDSGSMHLGPKGNTRFDRAARTLENDLLPRLRRNYQVRIARTSDDTTESGSRRERKDPHPDSGTSAGAQPSSPAGPQSLARALIRAASLPSSQPVDHLLLVSDGLHLGPEPLARAAAELPAPVSTLAVGEPEIRDVILERVSPPTFAYENDRALVSAELRSLGFSGEAPLRLLEVRAGGEREVATSQVTFPDGGGPVVGRVEFRTEAAGFRHYVLRVTPRAGELTERNNDLHFHLDVRPERIRVLFVEGEPSWEYRYVKQALERDPAADFHGLVRLPDNEWFYQGPEKRPDGKPVLRKPKDGFPIPAEELDTFEVLILGDLERKVFERSDGFAIIDRYVRTRGAGLLTVGGLKVYAAGDYEGTTLARLLPFEIRREKKKQLINRFQVGLAGEGMMHSVMLLDYDPVENEKIWSQLPWVEGGNAVQRVKAGATRLLVHPDLRTRYGPRPVMAAWQAGRGRVLSSALDGTWHWRLAAKTEEDYHRRFWGLAARWLAGDPRMRSSEAMIAEDPVIQVGQPASFAVLLRDPDGNPVLDAKVQFSVEWSGEPAYVLHAQCDPAAPGRYPLRFTPTTSGAHLVRSSVRLAEGSTSSQELTVYAQGARSEFLRVEPDAEAMSALAMAGSGSHALLEDHETLRLPSLPERRRVRPVVIELWQSPGLLILLTLCLCVEWAMRKRRGLA